MIAKPQLSLGRAAESDIHLPDLALEPDHARIEQVSERAIRVRATGTLGFELEGRIGLRAEIDPAQGAELRFGGHRITVSRDDDGEAEGATILRSEEHTSELQSLMRTSYAVFCLKKKNKQK